MKKKMRSESFAKNQRNLSESGSQGPFHPPRNSVVAMQQIESTFANSPRKKSPNFMLEYSVWNPATSSASASGRSNGARFVSANAVIMKIPKDTNPNGVVPNHHGSWSFTMLTSESDPA